MAEGERGGGERVPLIAALHDVAIGACIKVFGGLFGAACGADDVVPRRHDQCASRYKVEALGGVSIIQNDRRGSLWLNP